VVVISLFLLLLWLWLVYVDVVVVAAGLLLLQENGALRTALLGGNDRGQRSAAGRTLEGFYPRLWCQCLLVRHGLWPWPALS
jgi:hypothetical protein